MRLAHLRHQMLIAMGLPACWTQASAPPVKEPPPQPVYTPSKRVESQIAMFDPQSCGVDTIVETVCGRGDSEYCEGTAAKLRDAGERTESGLYVTSWDDARSSLRDFILDDKASEAYVTRLIGMGEKVEGRPGCCYSRCTPLVIGAAKPLPSPPPPAHMRTEQCIPAPPKGTTQPDQNNPSCPQGVEIQHELRPYSGTRNDLCCYVSLTRRIMIQKGRPARVEGEPRYATIAEGDAWHAGPMTVAPDDKLAASWLESARLEHASVAAFSATSLRLLQLGAPPELIAAAHRAALDEIEHARIAFALASAYAGRPLSPLAFDDATRVTPMTLRELALETFLDGCIGETVAAVEASREAESSTELAEVLSRISVDEARHAELAWQIVAWCVRRDPSIAADLRDALAHERGGPHDEVLREVVAPCLSALVA